MRQQPRTNRIYLAGETAVLVIDQDGERYEVLISREDAARVAGFSWRRIYQAYKNGNPLKTPTVYVSGYKPDGRGGVIHAWLHRLIMNPAKGYVVDHINGDAMDNRRENLRVVTRAENAQNRKVTYAASGVRNVYFQKQTQKYFVSFRTKERGTVHGGTFPTKFQAVQVAERMRPEILRFSTPAARNIFAETTA